jgi:hypothetical protein
VQYNGRGPDIQEGGHVKYPALPSLRHFRLQEADQLPEFHAILAIAMDAIILSQQVHKLVSLALLR